MLVLALQFSKGIAGVGIIAVELRQDAHRTRRGSGAEARAKREGTDMVRLPQNGREDKVCRYELERRTDPTTLEFVSTYPPVHHLGTGSNRVGRMPTID
jgi:hypothetical protein